MLKHRSLSHLLAHDRWITVVMTLFCYCAKIHDSCTSVDLPKWPFGLIKSYQNKPDSWYKVLTGTQPTDMMKMMTTVVVATVMRAWIASVCMQVHTSQRQNNMNKVATTYIQFPYVGIKLNANVTHF